MHLRTTKMQGIEKNRKTTNKANSEEEEGAFTFLFYISYLALRLHEKTQIEIEEFILL